MEKELREFFGDKFIRQTAENEIVIDLTEAKNGVRQNECTLKLEGKGSFIEIDDDYVKSRRDGLLYCENIGGLKLKRTCDGILLFHNEANKLLIVIEYKENINFNNFDSKICEQLDATFVKICLHLNLLVSIENINVIYVAVGKFTTYTEYNILQVEKNNYKSHIYNKLKRTGNINVSIPIRCETEINNSFRKQNIEFQHNECSNILRIN